MENMMEKNLLSDRLGRCFELNYKFVMANPEYLLVHGYITNFKVKPPVSIAHAWCKSENTIYDAVLNTSCEANAYHAFYDAEEVYVYNAKEAEISTLVNDTYGPWEELRERT
jgi:hypothetical protein